MEDRITRDATTVAVLEAAPAYGTTTASPTACNKACSSGSPQFSGL
jgi:hypothetical protein